MGNEHTIKDRVWPLYSLSCYYGQELDKHISFFSYFCQFSLPVYIFPLSAIFFVIYSAPVVCFGIYSFLYDLQGLKKNWEEVHKEFQSLSVFIDSIPKKIRKQKLEEEMKQLEHDIGVLEKHKVIYIANKK